MKKYKVLVLGCDGFTGRHFQAYAEKMRLFGRYAFVGIDRSCKESGSIKCRILDLSLPGVVEKLLTAEKPDYVINFAADCMPGDGFSAVKVNSEISLRILDTAANSRLKIKKILLIGSASEYGNIKKIPVTENDKIAPVTHYAMSKAVQALYAECYWQRFGVNVNVARTFNILGENLPGYLSIASFAEQIKKADRGGSIYVGNLNSRRDFLDISDVVDAYWKILTVGKSGEVYNVCMGKSFEIRDLLAYLIKKSGKKIKICTTSGLFKKIDVSDSRGDNSKLRKHTGWSPVVSVFDSLDKMLSSASDKK